MLSRTRARHHVVVAYLALFVALGGSAVAAKPLIDGADVRDESLTTADIQNDSLTGDDILESSLGKVASATTADSATTAGDADTLDGKNSTAFGAPNTAVHTKGTPADIRGATRVVATASNLTAGTWVLVAKTRVAGEETATCLLKAGTDELDRTADQLSSGDSHDNLSLMAVATLETTQDVTMACVAPETQAGTYAIGSDIVAIRAE